jgi:hypothetical protein
VANAERLEVENTHNTEIIPIVDKMNFILFAIMKVMSLIIKDNS